MNPNQRKAMFANAKKHTGMSRRMDLTLGALNNQGVPRLVRRISERKYSAPERMVRRGTFENRVADTLKQTAGEIIGSTAGAAASVLPVAMLAKRGKLGAATGVAYGAAALGGALGFGVARKHVNKKRDERLRKAGMEVKRIKK